MINVGIDWSDQDHEICILDAQGESLSTLKIPHSQAGFEQAHAAIAKHASSVDDVRIAIETRDSLFVDFLSELGYTLYFLNPRQTDRFRDRHRMSHSHTDPFDAYVLADAVRTDSNKFSTLSPLDEKSLLLRALCRARVNVIRRKVSIENELISALKRYFPLALNLFPSLDHPATIAFLMRYTTYKDACNASRADIISILTAHGLTKPAAEERAAAALQKLREPQPIPAANVAHALPIVVQSLLRQLDSVITEIAGIEKQIKTVYRDHPDKDLLESLPGIAATLGPVIASELGCDITRYSSLGILRAYAGTSPVTIRSGKSHGVHFRRACNQQLRRALHLAAATAIRTSSWARERYDRLRASGHSHGRALRAVADQLVEMIFVILTRRTPYDEAYHVRMQAIHGRVRQLA
ncbi:MAG: IS110 family transposase [Methanotrichaceae archaeon]|nr:IS110 family transposase [Methanotrichaceae archaeon]